MSYHVANGGNVLLQQAMSVVNKPMTSLAIAELGAQQVKSRPYTRNHKLFFARECFDFFGAKYMCLDVNHPVVASVHDLATRYEDAEHFGRYDIVTNFGTTEHVDRSQYEPFRTMHSLCRPGGVLVHMVPTGSHGCWSYLKEWFQWLCVTCGYAELRNDVIDKHQFLPPHKRATKNPVLCCYALMVRGVSGFCSEDKWKDPLRNA